MGTQRAAAAMLFVLALHALGLPTKQLSVLAPQGSCPAGCDSAPVSAPFVTHGDPMFKV